MPAGSTCLSTSPTDLNRSKVKLTGLLWPQHLAHAYGIHLPPCSSLGCGLQEQIWRRLCPFHRKHILRHILSVWQSNLPSTVNAQQMFLRIIQCGHLPTLAVFVTPQYLQCGEDHGHSQGVISFLSQPNLPKVVGKVSFISPLSSILSVALLQCCM